MDLKKLKKCRFDKVILSDLVSGDRFHFTTNKTAFTFERYSEDEKGYIYFKDGDYKEKIKKHDLAVIFLRIVKKR